MGLETNVTTTPLTTELSVVHELGVGHVDDALESGLILGLDLSEGNNGSLLLVHNLAKTSLVVNDNVRDTHLAAESRQPNDELNGVDVGGDDDKLGLLVLNEVSNVVQAEFGDNGLRADKLRDLLATLDGGLLGLSELDETFLLGLLVLRGILGQKLEEGKGLSAIKGLGELVDGGRHLETVIDDLLLALDTDVSRPADKARNISLVVNVVTNGEVLGLGREGLRSNLGLQ